MLRRQQRARAYSNVSMRKYPLWSLSSLTSLGPELTSRAKANGQGLCWRSRVVWDGSDGEAFRYQELSWLEPRGAILRFWVAAQVRGAKAPRDQRFSFWGFGQR